MRMEVSGDELTVRPIKTVRDVAGIFHEAAEGKPTDWETVRTETERLVAEDWARRNRVRRPRRSC